MLKKENIILVTGATGSQGGAVASALLKNGNTVRVIIRQSSLGSPAAEDLKKAGAEIVIADMENIASIEAALSGVYGVFSVQGMNDGTDSERRHADTLIAAASKMGVQHIVHASVNQTGNHDNFPGWTNDRWNKKYWIDKHHGEEAVRNAGFSHWTILRPVFFMDNFIPPKVSFMFPQLAEGRLTIAFKPASKLQMVAVEDTGTFATAAFNDVTRFDRQKIDLAGDELTIQEITEKISQVTGIAIKADYLSEAEIVKKGTNPGFANFQEWTNDVGYTVDINSLKNYGIPVTSFTEYLEKNRKLLPVATNDISRDAGIAVVRRNTEEVQSKGNFGIFEELFSPDFIDHTPQPGGFKADRNSVKRLYQMLRTAFPDFRAEIHWQTTDGDRVTTFKTYYGTHEGPIFGLAATGRKMHFESVDVMRVSNGMITDHWGVGNLLSLMQQLGGIPEIKQV
jgi:uncharacterized protein YbjT (DUF2867 family)/predicted ester cyclase